MLSKFFRADAQSLALVLVSAFLLIAPPGFAAEPVAAPSADQATNPAAGHAADSPSVFLEDLTWIELRDAIHAGKTTALVPIGGTEQSGPAIALGKHNIRVRILSERIAHALGDAIVAPVIAYVPEGSITPPTSHMRFPGTLSVPSDVFTATVESAARSLRAAGFREIVLLGDHGSYQRELAKLASRLSHEWKPAGVRVFAPEAYYKSASEGFDQLLRARGFRADEIGTHAALADTSLTLAADPALVRTEQLRPETRLDESVGVYGGDPRRASAELGRLGLDLIEHDTVLAIQADVRALAHTAQTKRTRSP